MVCHLTPDSLDQYWASPVKMISELPGSSCYRTHYSKTMELTINDYEYDYALRNLQQEWRGHTANRQGGVNTTGKPLYHINKILHTKANLLEKS